MKLFILVIASHSKEYDELIHLWRSIKYPDWIKIFFVFAEHDCPELVSVSGDTILVRGKDCICPGILYKTRAAMEYLLANEKFDYLLRSNLSSFFNAESLLEFLKDMPRTNAMFGELVFESFLSGSGYIMTPDVIQRFLDWDYSEEVNPMKMNDDEIVGKFMMLHDIPRFTWNMERATSLKDENAIQIRCHTLPQVVGLVKTYASPDYFRAQVERYNRQIYRSSDLVFYMAHYRSDEDSIQLLNHCVKSVKLYYPYAEIIICESDSTYERAGYDISGVIWLSNPIQNSGVIGCIKEYLDRYSSSKKHVVFLQDSIVLKGVFDREKLQRPFGFIWYFDVYHDIKSVKHEVLSNDLFNILSDGDMDCNDYVGCFGPSLYGSYESIQKLWNSIEIEKYMSIKERGIVLMDLERIIGASAFKLGLLTSIDRCSLCGDIFAFPQAFQKWYRGQSFEELQKYPYTGAAIKIWKQRWKITD